MKFKYILFIITLIAASSRSFATSYTWVGTSSSWNLSSNWSPSGIPDSADNVTISSGTYSPLLDGNRKITNLTLSSKTIDLNGYSLTVYGTATMTSGTVTNGTFYARGNLASFNGTLMDCPVDAICGYIRLSGSAFNETADFTDLGAATGTGSGGCTFNDDVTITHTGTLTYFTLANTTGDTFNGNVTFTNNSNREIHIASSGATLFNGNVILNSTSSGGISFANGGGSATLATGKTISIGSSGFSADFLTLKNFTQNGSTAQSLTLTGTAVVNMIAATFNGNITITAPGILIKNSTFNGTTTLTRNGSSGNHQSDGGNTFNLLTLDNAGSSGRIRWATTLPDTYNADATFSSTGGQDVQIAYSGDNIFAGNITINSNKVVFNTSTGKVTFTGTNNQTLNGSYNYPFKKLAINKSAGTVTANTTLSIDDSLIFIQGNLITTSTNLLIMKHGSSAIGASNNSFVSGPVKKVGNTAFEYPIGKESSYLPLKISAPSTTSSEFVAEYKDEDTYVNSTTRDSTLGYILRDKYWTLQRTSGSSQVYVTLSWNAGFRVMDSLITVASWNGTQWKNLGANPFTGSFGQGSVSGTSTSTSYNEFALGYLSLLMRPTLNCSAVTTQVELQSCVTALGAEVRIINQIHLDNIAPHVLPIQVFSDVTVTGFNSTLSSYPNWWEDSCPLLTSDFKALYDPANKANMFLFELDNGATIKNLRLRGSGCNYQDFNFDTYLSGGIISKQNLLAVEMTVENCEVSCFSYAGIMTHPRCSIFDVKDSYVHHVKGVGRTVGIGYGIWAMGHQNINSPYFEISLDNNIFDDCKAAIDGQGHPMNWNITKCSFSQFFVSEDINRHNSNLFKKRTPEDGISEEFDYHYCYNNTSNTCGSSTTGTFWGPQLSTPRPCSTVNIFDEPDFGANFIPFYDIDWILPSNYDGIPIYDVGGINTTINSCIFHKVWGNESASSNINLNFPNRDESNDRNGDENAQISITENTFAVTRHASDAFMNMAGEGKNRGGFGSVANNYINACVFQGDFNTINNSFNYKPGIEVSTPSPQPCEMKLTLKDNAGTNLLPTGFNFSATPGQTFVQYVAEGSPSYTPMKLFIDEGSFGGTGHTYIIRPNQINTNPVTSTQLGVISEENYFYDGEIRTSNISSGVAIDGYVKPGLYGIDVIGFDATSNPLDFRASSWQHIPVIVKPDSPNSKMLYFNIKDSYYVPNPIAATPVQEVYKQVELNGFPIWRESIAEGGNGWEYVGVDLTGDILDVSPPVTILSKLNLDGTPNVLTFSIVIKDGETINYTDLKGLMVWVDNVYIPKANSASGDNAIKDGSIELSNMEKWGETLNDECFWYRPENLYTISCDPLSITSGAAGESRIEYLPRDQNRDTLRIGASGAVSMDGKITRNERRSGQQALIIKLIAFKDDPSSSCTAYPDNGGNPLVSVATEIDFTDILSCDDYNPSSTNTMGFTSFPSFPMSPIAGVNYYLSGNITIDDGETLTLQGNTVAIAANTTIIVKAGGRLNIRPDGTKRTHLFACGDMWNGISNIDANTPGVSRGVIDAHTSTSSTYLNKIEDAICAIHCKGNRLELRNTTFDHNKSALQVEEVPNHTLSTSSRITGSFFLCSDKILSKAPHSGEIPYAHVTLTNIPFQIEFGKDHNTTQEISNSCVGLLLENSSVVIRNTEFKNIFNRLDLFLPNVRSSAILMEDYGMGGNRNVLIEDYLNVSTPMRNKFNKVNMGICVTSKPNDMTLTIKGCEFDNSDFNYTPVSPDFYNTAITIQGYLRRIQNINQRLVIINDNTITNFRYGIHALNTPNLNIGSDASNNPFPNTIKFSLGASPAIVDHYKGIWLQNCPNARITGGNNNMISDIENDVEVTSTGITNFRGIDIENSVGSRINCMTIKNIPQSVTFTGQCQLNLLRNNYFAGYNHAIELYSALLSPQYQDAGDPLDNHWMDESSNDRVTGTNASFDPIPWYRRSSGTEYDPDPLAVSGIIIPTTAGASTVLCNDYNSRISRDDMFGSIVADTLYFSENQDELEYLTRWETYMYMQNDTSILNLSESSDTTYQSFYAQIKTHNPGKLSHVTEQSLIPDSILVATTASEEITYENDIEYNKLLKNQVYLYKIALDSTMTETDSTTLETITELNWLQAGDAIYEAAAMLGKEIHPTVTSSRLAATNIEQVPANLVEQNSISVAPNPASQNIVIDCSCEELVKVEIYDSRNALVQIETQILKGQLISINLEPGIYRILAYDQLGNHYFGKFAVIK